MLIKQRIFDNYYQSWYSDINNSPRLQSYCIFKHNFDREIYLECIYERKYLIALSRFRVSAHHLFIESGRYSNIPREQRLCKSCSMKKLESEFHFLLVCPNYRDLRIRYFKPYFCHWPSLNKFASLLNSTSKIVINNLSKYLYFANKIRVSVWVWSKNMIVYYVLSIFVKIYLVHATVFLNLYMTFRKWYLYNNMSSLKICI